MSYADLSQILTVRPLSDWPGPRTRTPEVPRFTAAWSDTVSLLARELEAVKAKRAVLEVDMAPGDFRNDGLPRANAKARSHGVVLSFDSVHGSLRYAVDRFQTSHNWRSASRWERGGTVQLEGWQNNVRAIGLGLEALRKVDRYGITRSGEQYRGWAALPSGIPMSAPTHLTDEEAAKFIAKWGGGGWQDVLDRPDQYARSYRRAAKELHPDAGGDADDFALLQAAKAVLDRRRAA